MNVLKKLRIQVVFSIVFVLMMILAMILFALAVSVYKRENRAVFDFLQVLCQNEGRKPRPPIAFDKISPLTDFSEDKNHAEKIPNSFLPSKIRRNLDFRDMHNYFSVKISESGVLLEVISDAPLNYTDYETTQFVKEVLKQEKEKGIYEGIYYKVYKQILGDILVCFVNRRGELSVLKRFYMYSVMIYGVALLVAFIFAWIISGFVVQPVKLAFEKQKQFVADASHELKTPIAIIGANLDVLMPDFVGNKWLGYIKEENLRMSYLVKNLLFLARNDSERDTDNVTDFDFSQAVERAVLPFESVIFEEGKKLELEIEEHMAFTGDEEKIKQVIVILVDNAIKNSEKGAVIRVNACSDGQKKIVRVFNTGEGISVKEREKIFLRFYRSDSSRARKTGGCGLGLSIALAIAEKYGGSITVDSKIGEWVEFTFSLSSKRKYLSFLNR
ncbi:MAG: HAMP domain-containing histidine kinase [Treponema sp.]|nr:HAMP domain-containing histidine kinase [Treponema sp.]